MAWVQLQDVLQALAAEAMLQKIVLNEMVMWDMALQEMIIAKLMTTGKFEPAAGKTSA